jgi:hypothetical protein
MPEVKPKAKPRAKPKQKKKPPQVKLSKAMLEKAIPGTGGIISQIATKIGMSWHAIDDGIKRYQLEDKIMIEQEKNLDLAETQIVRAMQNGDVQTCKWFLATKGKQRGYVERTEVDDMGARNQIDALRAQINAMIINASTNPNTTNATIPGHTSEPAPSSK